MRRIVLLTLALLLGAVPSAGAQVSAPEDVFRVVAAKPSLELALALRAHLRQAGVRRPSGRVAVWIGEGNRGPRVSLVETNVPRELWGGVAPVVDAFLEARQETTPLELTFFLERLPEEGAAGIGRPARPPTLRDLDRMSRALMAIAQSSTAFAETGTLQVRTRLSMLVDDRGRTVLVENGMQGDADFQRYLTALAYEMRFDPAQVDGRRVAVWLEGPDVFVLTAP